MRLSRWSLTLLVAAGSCFVVLVLAGVWSARSHGAHEQRAAELVALQARADDLSVAADALLLGPFDGVVLQEFVGDADSLARDLESRLGTADAVAVRAVRDLANAVEAVGASTAVSAGAAVGPLGVPVEAARSMQQMAALGVEVDSAFDALLRDDFGGGVERAHREAVAFEVLAVVFSALSILVLFLLHRRVNAPLVALARVADRVSAGERSARAVVGDRDEVGQLGRSMNAMLDAMDATEQALVAQGRALAAERERLEVSQRIAHVATWSWQPASCAVTMSAEASRIVGRALDRAPVAVRELLAVVHEDDRARVLREVVGPLNRGERVAAVMRVVRPDGDVRTLRVFGEPQPTEIGGPQRITGTAQDVTDEYAQRSVADAHARLVAAAGRVARLGGWSVDVATMTSAWSDVVCEIHELPLGSAPPPERGIEYYAPEFQERIRKVFEACVRDAEPYDEELQIVTANGRRVWVRTTGTAVRDERGVVVRAEGAFQDIDARKLAEVRAVASERRLRETIESLGDPFVLADLDGSIAFANAAATAVVGMAPEALWGSDACEVFGSLVHVDERAALERAILERKPYVAEAWLAASERWFEVRVDPIDEVVAFQARDVTQQRALLERLRRHEEELRVSRDALAVALQAQRATFDALPANVAVLDDSGVIEHVNAGWRRFGEANGLDDANDFLGASYLEVVDRAAQHDEYARSTAVGLRQVIAGEAEEFDLEYPCHGPEREAWYRMSARRVNGGVNGSGRVVVMHVDITERMLAERSLAQIAHHDPLTTLWTRTGFVHALRDVLERGWSPDGVVAIMDLVGFRSVNDAHGLSVGDAALKAVGARLNEVVGSEGVVARAGGDLFAVYFRTGLRAQGAARGVETLLAGVFGAPFDVDGFALSLEVAIGYTSLAVDVRSTEELLREAEVALYDGGESDDGRVAAYTSELDTSSRARMRTTTELKDALEREEFELHFQPKVDLASGAVVAAEALIRWNHPERGLVPPGTFIPVAEQSGLIVPIGSWVLDAACQTLAHWQRDELPRIRIAVNVSVRQLVRGDFAWEVQQAIERHGIVPSDLTLEITESVYESESLHLRRQLRRLHAMGVQLALDDFGTGFSSLQYLKAYWFDEVKIDLSFVRDMVRDSYSRSVVETILGIARAIGAEAVAEGIETQRQRDLLEEMGCRIGQGYLFSAPVPEEDLRSLLQWPAASRKEADLRGGPPRGRVVQ